MKKALFIDRDGTLIVEPADTYQVDTLDQLEFLPKVIRNMHQIRTRLPFELVMVTNQDGLGTSVYPQENFDRVQGKMMQILEGEGIGFDAIHIDKSFSEDGLATRKPGTGMLTEYMNGDYDLSASYVIGDRLTDIILAKNLNAKGILIDGGEKLSDIKAQGLEPWCALITNDWDEIYRFLALPERTAQVKRTTKETNIDIQVNLDGSGQCSISTGLHFFDHMLEQIGRHSGLDLTIQVKGDLHVDEHHTVEDTGIALGEAIAKAIGGKVGMERYGYCLPMDDSLCLVALDFGGRPWIVWEADFKRERVGDVPTEMFFHFFKSLSDSARCNLTIKAQGDNEHHKIEGIFKAFAKSLKMALKRDPFNFQLPSTKGML